MAIVIINVNNSVYSTAGAALTFTASDDLVVAPNASLIAGAASGGNGLDMTGLGYVFTVENHGTIMGLGLKTSGILLAGSTSTATITNNVAGLIHGDAIGIQAFGNASIVNHGRISGNSFAAIYAGVDDDFTITNTGQLTSILGAGIIMAGTGTHFVNNSGYVLAGAGALSISSEDIAAVDFVLNTGLLHGDVNVGGAEDQVDTRSGLIYGDIYLGDGGDLFYGSRDTDYVFGGADNDRLLGYAGNDLLDGGSGKDTLDGMSGADEMLGGTGDDTYYADNALDRVFEVASQGLADCVKSSVSYSLMYAPINSIESLETTNAAGTTAINLTGNNQANSIVGNAGSNILNGMLGNDVLTGGIGKDAFVFSTAPSATLNRDTITDFNVLLDTIRLENAVFTRLVGVNTLTTAQFYKSTTAVTSHDIDDRIIYNTTTGALYYDADGNQARGVAAVQFATLTGSPDTVTNADFFII